MTITDQYGESLHLYSDVVQIDCTGALVHWCTGESLQRSCCGVPAGLVLMAQTLRRLSRYFQSVKTVSIRWRVSIYGHLVGLFTSWFVIAPGVTQRADLLPRMALVW